MNSPETDAEQGAKNMDNFQNIPEEQDVQERSSSELLKTYLKNIGHCRGKKRRRCISEELHNTTTVLDSKVPLS